MNRYALTLQDMAVRYNKLIEDKGDDITNIEGVLSLNDIADEELLTGKWALTENFCMLIHIKFIVKSLVFDIIASMADAGVAYMDTPESAQDMLYEITLVMEDIANEGNDIETL